ncbi:flagellar motor switch protein FliM [Jatrophihabitans fulvus]
MTVPAAPTPVIELATRKPVRTAPPAPTPYDFRRPTKVSREHVRVLQLAFDTLARRLTTLLTSGLRQVCQVQVGEVAQESWDDYVAKLDSPSVTVPVMAQPLNAAMTVNFSLQVALAAIDHMLGGPGGDQPTRPLTDIELPLLSTILDQIVGVLRYSLDPVVTLETSIGAVEYNPQFLQAAGAADAVLVAHFTLQIGSVSSPLLISLPLAQMLPVLEAQAPVETAADPVAQAEMAAKLGARVRDVTLDVALEFEPVRLTADRILGLAVGDVVAVDQRVGTPLTVRAGGVAYARAVAGRSGTRLAALVVEGPSPIGAATPRKESK